MIGISDGLRDDECREYSQLLAGLNDCAQHIAQLPDYQPRKRSKYARENIHRPSGEENVLGNAWAHKFHIRGDRAGRSLKGKTVCVKDCIAVADVPQFFGTDAIGPWTPTVDATVVTRALDAGADVVGTATCENFCNSTSSFTSAQGVVENPYARGYSAGGSTSGGAALVGGGHTDIAIGADQGGSVRVPAAFCGCMQLRYTCAPGADRQAGVGLKPTHGLIPYTGVTSGDALNDHVGPIARTVFEVASCLDALAGRDNLDDRTLGAPLPGSSAYASALSAANQNIACFRVGILREGFEHNLVDATVKEHVLKAALSFEQLGACVEPVSLPCHLEGPGIWTVQQRISGSLSLLGLQTGRRGCFMIGFEDARLPWTDVKFQRLFPATKNTMINGLHLMRNYPGLYAKTLNMAQRLRDSYDELFRNFDIVVMPTTPCVAPKHIDWMEGESALKALRPSIGLTINTAIFNLTGHPAMNLPVGLLPSPDHGSVELPVGMQIVSGLWQEQKVLDAGYAWESSFGWKDNRFDGGISNAARSSLKL
jgi:amidase